MNWTPPSLQRHEALADFLVQLGLDYGEEPRVREVPDVLTLAGHHIALEPWERALLQQSLGDSEQGQPWAPLLAEGLAFQMKCLAKLEPQATDDADGSPYIPAQPDVEGLITDAAVGLALLQETQRTIDQMVVAGEIAEAKKLTAFRNKVGQTVARLRDAIGEAEFPRAENKAEGMVNPVGQHGSLVSRSVGPNPLGAGQTWDGRRKKTDGSRTVIVTNTSAEESERSRLGPLTGLLVVLTIVWAVFVLPKLMTPEPHILETAEFTDVPGIVSTVAKPPTVYITVDKGLWGDMPGQDRKKMIAEIGNVAEERGYIGADIRDDDGTVIGRWLKARGASLVNP